MQVYNVTKFLEDHPGGDDVLLSSTGLYKHNYHHAPGLVEINPSVFDSYSLFR